jgi:hypothetical protein
VYAENWEAVQVFLAMQTQWRTAAFSGLGSARLMYVGLDYSAIDPVCRMLDVKRKRRAAIFQSLRIMENAVLDALQSE